MRPLPIGRKSCGTSLQNGSIWARFSFGSTSRTHRTAHSVKAQDTTDYRTFILLLLVHIHARMPRHRFHTHHSRLDLTSLRALRARAQNLATSGRKTLRPKLYSRQFFRGASSTDETKYPTPIRCRRRRAGFRIRLQIQTHHHLRHQTDPPPGGPGADSGKTQPLPKKLAHHGPSGDEALPRLADNY